MPLYIKKEQERRSDAFLSDSNTASEATLKTKWLHFVYGFRIAETPRVEFIRPAFKMISFQLPFESVR